MTMHPRAPLPIEDALSETFLAGSGPGGQNANRVATAVQLRVDLARLSLDARTLNRLRALAGQWLTRRDELVIVAREFRTREANRIAARQRLIALIVRAGHRPVPRRPSRPSLASRARRLDAKRGRSAIKAARAPVRPD